MKKLIEKLEHIAGIGGTKKDIVFLIISGIALILSLMDYAPFGIDMAWISIFFCGIPIIAEALIGLISAFDIKADVLVSIALIASVCIGEDFAAGEVAFIMQLGALLEELTVAKARAGIEKLVKLTPQTARVLSNGEEHVVPARNVQVNDILRILPGESIPVDGIIVSGHTSVDQSVMTGESMPVDKAEGDEVSSGTVNQYGAFTMRASRVGEDSSIQRMIRLVQSADAGKAKIVGIADRWATWVVVIALSAALLTWLISGMIIRAVTILVVFCPCALVLATPTAIMAAIGNATKHGFLVREGDALERLAEVDILALDKTGTVTLGAPEVIAVKGQGIVDDDSLFRMTACAERFSEHPLGKAVVSSYLNGGGELSGTVESFTMLPGHGVTACVDGKQLIAGNERLLRDKGVAFTIPQSAAEYMGQGCTIVFISINGVFAGYLALSDTLRENSRDMIKGLTELRITPVLLTGDNERAAGHISRELGISELRTNCLPEDKLRYISEFQRDGKKVCMIGDGVNDAPALKKADVGIAMGGIGSDIAVDAADIALVNDDVKELPHLIALSKRMLKTIKINMAFSMGLNFLAIVLAITGKIDPVVGALVHNAGSVLVITDSALLLNWRKKQ